MLTIDQIREFLSENKSCVESLEYDNATGIIVLEGHTFEHVDQHGGMGEGDDYYVIFSVKQGDEKNFYKIPGWYASHQGRELEVSGTFQVAPKEVTIIQWEAVK